MYAFKCRIKATNIFKTYSVYAFTIKIYFGCISLLSVLNFNQRIQNNRLYKNCLHNHNNMIGTYYRCDNAITPKIFCGKNMFTQNG